jgi:hypothetical protein
MVRMRDRFPSRWLRCSSHLAATEELPHNGGTLPERRAMHGERMDRREFLVRVLGLGGIAAASLAVAGCGGDEDDEEEEEDD